VVVLNYRGRAQVQECFAAVLAQEAADYEVIFVDNKSDDGSFELARTLAASSRVPCRFIQMEENVGYCRGKNAGAAVATGEFLWLLDNDIKPGPDVLTKLVCFMREHPGVALCGPVQYDFVEPGRRVGGGFLMRLLLPPRLCTAPDEAGAFRPVSFITGGVMFVRRGVWETLGGFEPSGVFFLDDADFGPRCWIAGHQVMLLGGCSVRHFRISRSSHAGWRWRVRQLAPGTVRGMIRNYKAISLLAALPAFVAFYVLKALKNVVWRRDPRILLDCASGLTDMCLGLRESLRQRRRIQALRVVRGNPFLGL